MNKFWMTCAFIEMVLWTVMVPYLIWQQWHWAPAVGLLGWWLFGYWRLTVVGLINYHRWRRALDEAVDTMTDPDFYRDDEKTEQEIDPEDESIHNWIDGKK